jgi:hypothetical protein
MSLHRCKSIYRLLLFPYPDNLSVIGLNHSVQVRIWEPFSLSIWKLHIVVQQNQANYQLHYRTCIPSSRVSKSPIAPVNIVMLYSGNLVLGYSLIYFRLRLVEAVSVKCFRILMIFRISYHRSRRKADELPFRQE